MDQKIRIEKNSVQETLLIPLYSRVQCTRLYPELYSDPESERALERVEYDFSGVSADGAAVKFGALEVAMRQSDIAIEVREYLAEHPGAAVVNMGCGLDPMSRNLDNGTCRIYNLDLPDVIAVRNQIFPAGEREENIACDLNDCAWFDKIDARDGVIFYACGVFYYFTIENVQKLFCAMNERFPGGRLVCDTAGKLALKIMLKGVVKKAAGIDNVSGYFHAGKPEKDVVPWSNGFQVSYKGYMLGYNELKVPSVSGTFRFMSKVADGIMQMKILRLDFA